MRGRGRRRVVSKSLIMASPPMDTDEGGGRGGGCQRGGVMRGWGGVGCREQTPAMTAGMIANKRVINRRYTGRIFQFINPSMMICPARVPVSVEF